MDSKPVPSFEEWIAMFTLVQWSASLLMLKRREKGDKKREEVYSDTRSAQWREMVRIGRFKQQENMQNFKNTIYLFKFKFKLVFQMKQLNECPTKL